MSLVTYWASQAVQRWTWEFDLLSQKFLRNVKLEDGFAGLSLINGLAYHNIIFNHLDC